jgi:hypothetical protein
MTNSSSNGMDASLRHNRSDYTKITALQAQINKTDRNDARGIAQMMRVGLYRPVQQQLAMGQQHSQFLTA